MKISIKVKNIGIPSISWALNLELSVSTEIDPGPHHGCFWLLAIKGCFPRNGWCGLSHLYMSYMKAEEWMDHRTYVEALLYRSSP